MGAAAVANLVVAESMEADPHAPADERSASDGALDSAKTVLSALSAWIPSEALGLYTLIYGTLIPKSQDQQVTTADVGTVMGGQSPIAIQVPSASDQLQLFFIVLGVSILLLVVQAEGARRREARRPGRRLKANWRLGYLLRTAISILLTTLALVLYIANAPGNPFVAPVGFIDAEWAPGYAAVAALLIPIVALALKIRAPTGDE